MIMRIYSSKKNSPMRSIGESSIERSFDLAPRALRGESSIEPFDLRPCSKDVFYAYTISNCGYLFYRHPAQKMQIRIFLQNNFFLFPHITLERHSQIFVF